jgi:hypothetical protein
MQVFSLIPSIGLALARVMDWESWIIMLARSPKVVTFFLLPDNKWERFRDPLPNFIVGAFPAMAWLYEND